MDVAEQETFIVPQSPATSVNQGWTAAVLKDATLRIDATRYGVSLAPYCWCVAEGLNELNVQQVTSTGRGGAGNLRSPSRDARAAAEAAIRIDGRYIRERYSKKGEKFVRVHLPCSISLSFLPVLVPDRPLASHSFYETYTDVYPLLVLDRPGWSREHIPLRDTPSRSLRPCPTQPFLLYQSWEILEFRQSCLSVLPAEQTGGGRQ
jgi:hypothetical protein